MVIRVTVAILGLVVGACSIRPPSDTARCRSPRSAPWTTMSRRPTWRLGVRGAGADSQQSGRCRPRQRRPSTILAGELASNPRWVMMSPLTKQKMLQARVRCPACAGIVPNVPSQVVVTTLLRFAAAWQAGDQAAAMQALAAPGFTLPPEQTLQVVVRSALHPVGQHRQHRRSEPDAAGR